MAVKCLFCRIVKGEIPSYKIYEDKDFLAFLDIFPKTTGHTLVIPKLHCQWVWDYPKAGEYWEIVTKIANHLRKVSGEQVRALVFGFDVPHSHIHLLPGKIDKFTGEKRADDEMQAIRAKFSMLE